MKTHYEGYDYIFYNMIELSFTREEYINKQSLLGLAFQ